MDIFSIKKGEANKLTVDDYEDATKKKYPYYQVNSNKLMYYGICPECGNPIRILNLYGAEMMQRKTRIVKTYARHTPGEVRGFSFWNRDDKENCSLYNPSPLGNEDIRKNDAYSEELKNLIESKRQQIYRDIRKILGINLSTKLLDKIYDVFMGSKSYYFKAVNRYNIPYAMLRYQQSISLFGQYIDKSKMGEPLIEAINNYSRFFYVDINRKIMKKVPDFRTIDMIFTKYRRYRNIQFVQMEVIEALDGGQNYTIFKKELEIEVFIYD